MEPDPSPEPDVWWIAAVYLAANSVFALDPAITSRLGLQLAATFAAGALAFVLTGMTGRCRRTPQPIP